MPPGVALTDHKIDQFSLHTEAGHKSRGGAGVVGTDEDHLLNYGVSFCCRFAADAANDPSRYNSRLRYVGGGGLETGSPESGSPADATGTDKAERP